MWVTSPVVTLSLCSQLGNLSLLSDVDFVCNTIRIHNVIRSYLIQTTSDFPALHQRFLDAYGLADWTQLSPNEPYLWNHLAYHLIQADRSAGNSGCL